MRILLTGATGYIGQRLIHALIDKGHQVICCVGDQKRFHINPYPNISVIEVNFLEKQTLKNIPTDIDIAYYLIHSMSTHQGDFETLEQECANNFKQALSKTNVRQVIYLSGIINDQNLSKHLQSRKKVEHILSEDNINLTTLRAGIIIGSGSASFEIIRDLVEKLPIMITPKWLLTKTQPIAVRNVIEYLIGVIDFEKAFHQSFDIGGPDILTYKEMLLQFAYVRNLKRKITTVPVMTPKLSSYWLYFVTATSFRLAQNLVNSLKVEVICRPNELNQWLGIDPIDYKTSVRLAFDKIKQNQVVSSWKDAQTTNLLDKGISSYIEVPTHGCFQDKQILKVQNPQGTFNRLWSIGGKQGWYFANFLWEIRGFLDQLMGGVGMRRGRKSPTEISPGETLDFWRVLVANKDQRRLLLYAEMKLPGEAWLEFELTPNDELIQTATFRPLGIFGRLYWFGIYPLHKIIFKGMIRNLAKP